MPQRTRRKHGSRAGLARLIAPAPVETFAATLWGRATCRAAGALAGERPFLDIDGFEAMVARLGDAANGWLHLARGGLCALPPSLLDGDGLVDLARLRSAFAQGHTLYLTKAQRLDPALACWADAIAGDLADAGVALDREVSAHLFLTPPGGQGFAPHRDAHASFIVQLEGSKEWLVYPPDPADGEDAAGAQPGPVPAGALAGRAAEIHRLAPGDVLFMPEWWPHHARAGERASLHVTFRLFPLRGEPLPAALRRQRIPRRPRPGRTLSQIGRLPELTAQTRLVRARAGPCECFAHQGRAHLLFPGGEVCGPEAFLPVFDYVIRRRTFRPADLPELEQADYHRLDLVRAMIRDGLVEFADGG